MAGTNFTRQIHPVLSFIISIIISLLRRLGLRDNIHTPAVSGVRLADIAATGGVSMTDDSAQLCQPKSSVHAYRIMPRGHRVTCCDHALAPAR